MGGLLLFFDEVQRRDFIQEELGVNNPFPDALSVKDLEN
jgi:hypothetical protein